jgi:hypothetical protein
MDLRFVVFNRIARDELLRRLLVNYADRVEAGAGRRTGAGGFLALTWLACDGPAATAGPEMLSARIHVPDGAPEGIGYLEHVLQRLRMAVTGDAGDVTVVARCLGSSARVTASSIDTHFMTTTFLVARTPPWPGPVDAVTAEFVEAGGRARSMN